MTICRCCGQEIRATTEDPLVAAPATLTLWVDDSVAELCNRAREEAERCGSAEVDVAHLAVAIAREARHERELARSGVDRFALIVGAERRIATLQRRSAGSTPRTSDGLRTLLGRAQALSAERGQRFAQVSDLANALAEHDAETGMRSWSDGAAGRGGGAASFTQPGDGEPFASKPTVRVAAQQSSTWDTPRTAPSWHPSSFDRERPADGVDARRLEGVEAAVSALGDRMAALTRTLADIEPARNPAAAGTHALETAIARLGHRLDEISVQQKEDRREPAQLETQGLLTVLSERLDRQDRRIADLLDNLAHLHRATVDAGRHAPSRHGGEARTRDTGDGAGSAEAGGEVSGGGTGDRPDASDESSKGRRTWRIRQRSDWPRRRMKSQSEPAERQGDTETVPRLRMVRTDEGNAEAERYSGGDRSAAATAKAAAAALFRSAAASDPSSATGPVSEDAADERGDRDKRFYLSADDDIVQAPSIGPKTAARLQTCGLYRVRDLLRCNPARVAERLGLQYLTARRIAEWQAQARLVCTVPWLRGTHAQLLVGSGYDTLAKLKDADRGDVCAAVLHFAATRDGQSVLRSGPPPDMEKIAGWLDHAQIAEPQRAA